MCIQLNIEAGSRYERIGFFHAVFYYRERTGCTVFNPVISVDLLNSFLPEVWYSLVLRSVYKELHADHETGAADNK